jgi:hypothetical protein
VARCAIAAWFGKRSVRGAWCPNRCLSSTWKRLTACKIGNCRYRGLVREGLHPFELTGRPLKPARWDNKGNRDEESLISRLLT